MLVCLCRGVSDREVQRAILRGASTLKEVARACGAGLDCGSCRDLLRSLLGSGSPQGCEGRGGTSEAPRNPGLGGS
jgi:bacterioferritin-associated ferredoxin